MIVYFSEALSDYTAIASRSSTLLKETAMTESYKLSYCLDINVGYDRTYRERLIDFLREVGKDFTVTTVERGHFCGMYQLRIATTKAHELQAHIIRNRQNGRRLRLCNPLFRN